MFAAALERRGSPERRVKRNVVAPFPGRPRLNVAPALAIRAGLAAAARFLARQPIQRRVELARRERCAGVNLFAAFPPMRALVIENGLRRRFSFAQIGRFFGLLAGYGFTFFLTEVSSLDGVASA